MGPLLCFLLLCAVEVRAQGSESAAWMRGRARAQTALREAQLAYTNQPSCPEAVWKLGRAYFEMGEFSGSKRERAELAEIGMGVCRRAVELQSNSAPAHFYWGLNMGQLARTKGIGALRLVSQMRDHFQNAVRFDERFHYAGPHRSLGYLFRDAPSWGSIGDKQKAQYHLQRAVKLWPDYPENRLALLEGRIQWGEKELAVKELQELEQMWAAARETFAGPEWETAWEDWENQLSVLRKKVRR